MTKIISIDPGMTSGAVWGTFDQGVPFLREGYAEIPGGMQGFEHWLHRRGWFGLHSFDHVVCERFKPRPMARNYRLDELEPLRIEGQVYVHAPRVVFQWPEQRGWGKHGIKTAAETLVKTGLWLVPSDIPNHDDADDANSAQMHLLAYMRNIGHMPTIEAYLR